MYLILACCFCVTPACMSTGSELLVRGLLLRNTVLPSRHLVDSGLVAPAPLAFNLSSLNASLVLDSCTLSTTCANLAQFVEWVSGQELQVYHYTVHQHQHEVSVHCFSPQTHFGSG